MSTAPVTLLFTDLVNSTELLERAGDEHTQRILRTHHLALQQAVAIHGGSEVKWLGDGLMSVFASPADASSFGLSNICATLGGHLSLGH